MGFFNICPDPMIETLRDMFKADIVRIPDESIRPLLVVARCGDKISRRGELAHLLRCQGSTPPGAEMFQTSRLPDLSGKKSSSVDLDLGLQILDGFLKGLGLDQVGIDEQFKGAKKVSFRFGDVKRIYVDINELGGILADCAVDRFNPAAAPFFDDPPCQFLLLDSVITSPEFSVTVEEAKDNDFGIDIPVVQDLVSKVGAKVSVSGSSRRELVFKGDRELAYAFSKVPVRMDLQGNISSLGVDDEFMVLKKGAKPGSPEAARVLLADRPAMIDWDE